MGSGLTPDLLDEWRFCLASVRGTSHEADDVPCQDHAEIAAIPGLQGQTLIAVACDGAGSAANAAEGARVASMAFLEFARLQVEAGDLSLDFAAAALDDVRQHVEVVAQERGEPVSSFACTLVAAIILPGGARFVQVGDGAAAFRFQDEPWRLALTPQRGEFVNETVFVTREDAAAYLREFRAARPLAEFEMMTDGVEHLAVRHADGVVHAPFMDHVLAGLRRAEVGYSGAEAARLADFLASGPVNGRTDDDKSLILGTRVSQG